MSICQKFPKKKNLNAAFRLLRHSGYFAAQNFAVAEPALGPRYRTDMIGLSFITGRRLPIWPKAASVISLGPAIRTRLSVSCHPAAF